jgi:hypothetical protein
VSGAGGRSNARGAGVLGVVGLLGGSVLLLPTAEAASPSVFGAAATAGGIQFSFSNDSLPVVQTYELTTPATSSTLSSLGNSLSFASAPSPGDVVQNLPSVAGALVPVPVPPYPFYVAVGTGEDPKEINYPGLTLRAEAGATVVQSRATVGADGVGGISTSRTEVLGDGSVRAVGSAVYKVLDLGPQVSFRGVDASAAVTSSDGQLTRTSSLSINRIRIPGLAITIPDSAPFGAAGGRTLEQPDIGFEDGHFTIQLPFLGGNTYELPASVLAEGLKAAGISMTFQQAQETKNGIIAPALTVSYAVPTPPENPLYNGPGTVRYVVGQAAASVTVPSGAADAQLPGSSGVANGNGTGAGVLPSTAGIDAAAGSLPALGAGLGGSLPAVAGTPSAVNGTFAASPVVRADRVTYSAPFTKDLSAIYLVVVALAALGVLVSILRQLGVRAR